MSDYRLYPCPSCYRHVQPSTPRCPFCGAALPPPPPAPPPVPDELAQLRNEVTIYGAPAPPPPVPGYGAPPPPLRQWAENGDQVTLHPVPVQPLRRGRAAALIAWILLAAAALAAIGWLVLAKLAHGL